MELSGLTLTFITIVLLILLYVYYMSQNHGCLKKDGIPGPTPWPLFGNFIQEMKGGLSNYHQHLYLKHKTDKVYGIYRGKQAIIMLCDLDMIKKVCVNNFQHFTNRTTFEIDAPFDNSLTQLRDEHWKTVRTTISPAFNTVRLKRMYSHIERNTKVLLKFLQDKQEKNEPLELKEVISRYTMDVIASTGFGIEINSLEDENNEFTTETKKMFSSVGYVMVMAFFFKFMIPILKIFGVGLFPKSTINFYKKFIDVVLESRKQETGSNRPIADFLQLMLEAEKDSTTEDDNMSSDEAKALNSQTRKRVLSHNDMQGQAIQFILAGYDTVATALSYALFLMTLNQETVEKAQEEVDTKLKGQFPTYDSAQSLTYLEMCLNESMRMFSVAPLLDRMCSEDIVVDGVQIKKGVSVGWPVCAIHYDPSIWPDPEKFIPERFTQENKAKRHPYSHMPFGQGPRNCIGQRLALLEMKVAIASILQKFTPVKCEKSKYPEQFNSFRMVAKDGLWIKLEARK